MSEISRRLKILSSAKKIKSINYLGGVCERCGENNIHKLCFHHIDGKTKEFEVNRGKYMRWSKLESELNKCELLCHNCHLCHHFSFDSIDKRSKNNKKIFLEHIGYSYCMGCGYDKCNSSLHFHHESDKKFNLAKVGVNYKNIDDVCELVIEELDKCVVLCANCHYEKHTDIDFYNDNMEYILNKVDNMRENSPKIDRDLVYKMYIINDMTQSEISKHFGCDRGTICKIIKKNKFIKKKNKELVIDLFESGMSKTEISVDLNLSYNTIKYHLRQHT